MGTSVAKNSPSQNSSHPEDYFQSNQKIHISEKFFSFICFGTGEPDQGHLPTKWEDFEGLTDYLTQTKIIE